MYISTKASRARQREAQNARDNRAEIVKALSLGEITRRDPLPDRPRRYPERGRCFRNSHERAHDYMVATAFPVV